MARFIIISLIAAIAGGVLANSKGRNSLIWAVVCFFFPFLILILLVLPPRLSQGITKQCARCHKIIRADSAVCSFCNYEQPIQLVQCAGCGKFVSRKDYCEECNRKMNH